MRHTRGFFERLLFTRHLEARLEGIQGKDPFYGSGLHPALRKMPVILGDTSKGCYLPVILRHASKGYKGKTLFMGAGYIPR